VPIQQTPTYTLDLTLFNGQLTPNTHKKRQQPADGMSEQNRKIASLKAGKSLIYSWDAERQSSIRLVGQLGHDA